MTDRDTCSDVEIVRVPINPPKTKILVANPNPKSNLTLFSHIYNEEFLLPHWIKHHISLFDHAVIVDYGSTDNSLNIIKEMAPNWEIRRTRNSFFEEPAIGGEMMDIEEEFGGWKMILNTTEFLLHPDIRSYTKQLDAQGKKGIRTSGVVLVDTPETRGEFDPDQLLVLQKTHGYLESDVTQRISTTGTKMLSRSRLIHNQPCGKYSGGRHSNGVAHETDSNLLLCWAGWSPFDYVKERKKQIQYKVSEKQKTKQVWAKCYIVDDEKLEKMFQDEYSRSYDLLSKERFKQAYCFFKKGTCD